MSEDTKQGVVLGSVVVLAISIISAAMSYDTARDAAVLEACVASGKPPKECRILTHGDTCR